MEYSYKDYVNETKDAHEAAMSLKSWEANNKPTLLEYHYTHFPVITTAKHGNPNTKGIDMKKTIFSTATQEKRDAYIAYVNQAKGDYQGALVYKDWEKLGCLSLSEMVNKFGIGESCKMIIGATNDGQATFAEPRAKVAREKVAKVARVGGKMRIPAMFEAGIIKAGDKVEVLNRADSEAVVVDAKTVNYKGETLSFNDYGCKVVGHVAINVYIWLTINGVLLDTLRGSQAKVDTPSATNTQGETDTIDEPLDGGEFDENGVII